MPKFTAPDRAALTSVCGPAPPDEHGAFADAMRGLADILQNVLRHTGAEGGAVGPALGRTRAVDHINNPRTARTRAGFGRPAVENLRVAHTFGMSSALGQAIPDKNIMRFHSRACLQLGELCARTEQNQTRNTVL
jgi:hypothetical protein